jgi:hypothetical protein
MLLTAFCIQVIVLLLFIYPGALPPLLLFILISSFLSMLSVLPLRPPTLQTFSFYISSPVSFPSHSVPLPRY